MAVQPLPFLEVFGGSYLGVDSTTDRREGIVSVICLNDTRVREIGIQNPNDTRVRGFGIQGTDRARKCVLR